MKATEFCYWLQSTFELMDAKSFDEKQTEIIKRHLAMAFLHDIDKRAPDAEQKPLNEIHSGQLDPSKVVLRC